MVSVVILVSSAILLVLKSSGDVVTRIAYTYTSSRLCLTPIVDRICRAASA